jgi:CBS-domain-containing membrane protein
MTTAQTTPHARRLVLDEMSAADLMSPNPVSIREEASVQEAIAMLTDRGFSAAPVIDEAGRPVGVLSRADILVHERELSMAPQPDLEEEEPVERTVRVQRPLPSGFSVAVVDPTQVRDIMTPAVFSVTPETPANKVVEQMLELNVHQLYVVDHEQFLIGVISTLDVLRHLHE